MQQCLPAEETTGTTVRYLKMYGLLDLNQQIAKE